MKIFYLRDKKRNPVACVAWEPSEKGIHFGISTHNEDEDKYKQENGRAMAVGRFILAPHTIEIALESARNPPTIIRTVAQEHEFPTRARRAAALWLKNPPKPKTRKSRAA